MGLAETKQVIDAASAAFKTWSKTSAKVRAMPVPRAPCAHAGGGGLQERHDILKKFYALMQEHTDDRARLIVGILCFYHPCRR